MGEGTQAKAIVRIITALLKHRLKKTFGDEALSVIGSELVDLTGEQSKQKIDGWFSSQDISGRVLAAAQRADVDFQLHCSNERLAQWMASLPLASLPDLQKVIQELPTRADESDLEKALRHAVARDWKKLTPTQIDQAVGTYLQCLRQALAVEESFIHDVIVKSVLRIEPVVHEIFIRVKATEVNIQQMNELLVRQMEVEKKPQRRRLRKPPVKGLAEPGALPPDSQILFGRNAAFTDRTSHLLSLAGTLSPKSRSSLPSLAIVMGMAGVGKKQLAAEFCYRYGRYFRGVHWLDGRGDLSTSIAGSTQSPGLPAVVEQQAMNTLQAWGADGPRLVVVYDLEDPGVLEPWRPLIANASILITSSRTNWPVEWGASHEILPVLSLEDSRILIRRLAPRLQTEPDFAVDELNDWLGRLPQALKLAAGYLNTYAGVSIKGYSQRLAESGILGSIDLAGVVAVQWNALQDERARFALQTAAFLGTDRIPRPRLALFTGLEDKSTGFASPLELALVSLSNLSLIEGLNEFEFRLHPLVSEFATLQTTTDERSRLGLRLAANVRAGLADPDGYAQNALVAGEALLALPGGIDWQALDLRAPVVQALLSLVKDGSAHRSERRQALLLLARLDWIIDVIALPPQEMLAALNLAGRYAASSQERQFIVRSITPVLALPDLESGLEAQFLVFRAAMLAQLGDWPAALNDYQQAETRLEAQRASGSGSVEDWLTRARLELGRGQYAVEKVMSVPDDPAARQDWLEQAGGHFQRALSAAREYHLDPIFEANVNSELSYLQALWGNWAEAELAYQTALNRLEQMGKSDADPEEWVICQAKVLETASMVSWEKGQSQPDGSQVALAEYKLAYEKVAQEILLLQQASIRDPLGEVIAHLNAGDYLEAMSACPGAEPGLLAVAYNHRKFARDLAAKLHLLEWVEIATTQLENHLFVKS